MTTEGHKDFGPDVTSLKLRYIESLMSLVTQHFVMGMSTDGYAHWLALLDRIEWLLTKAGMQAAIPTFAEWLKEQDGDNQVDEPDEAPSQEEPGTDLPARSAQAGTKATAEPTVEPVPSLPKTWGGARFCAQCGAYVMSRKHREQCLGKPYVRTGGREHKDSSTVGAEAGPPPAVDMPALGVVQKDEAPHDEQDPDIIPTDLPGQPVPVLERHEVESNGTRIATEIESGHVHRWVIEPPDGPTSRGRCWCGEWKAFANSISDADKRVPTL